MRDFSSFVNELQNNLFLEDKLPDQADIIFLPGNGYPHMAKRAASLYQEGRAPLILPSGRYSIVNGHFQSACPEAALYGESFETEWEFLRAVLLRHKVPDSAILREDQATFTYENAIYSRQVTDKAGISVKKAILCCKNYHARRALLYYQLLYPETEFFVAPVVADGITKENWRDSEEHITMVSGEIERIIKQFSLMLKM